MPNTMPNTMQHHHVTLRPKADQIEATRVLLLECAMLVANRKAENGPLSWCASFEEAAQVFSVEALFPNQEALAFHQENIQSVLRKFAPCMVAPPETIVRKVFLSA